MRQIGRFKVTVAADEEYVWEPDTTTAAEAIMLETEFGRPFKYWVGAVGDDDISAFRLLVWYLRRKAGRQEDLAAVNFTLSEFDITAVPEDASSDPEASAGSAPATSDSSQQPSESGPGSSTGSPLLTSVS